jgi:hypothetical protein
MRKDNGWLFYVPIHLSVCVQDQLIMDWKARIQFPAGTEIFLFATTSIPALEHTHTPNQWKLGAVSPRVEQLGLHSWPLTSI